MVLVSVVNTSRVSCLVASLNLTRFFSSYLVPIFDSQDHLADAGASVYLWSRSKDVVESLNTTRRNPKYLQEHEFSENITAIGPEFPSKDLLTGVDVVLFAIPTQNLR